MSLINDALKQAKAAQPTVTAPAEGPALRPVEREHRSNGNGFLLPALIVVVLGLAVTLLWIWFHGSGQSNVTVRARTVPEVTSVAAEPGNPAVTAPTPVQAKPVHTVGSAPAEPVTDLTNAVAIAAVVTNAVVIKPEPPTYKLQAIFYKPSQPSAMINGKMMFVGDNLKGVRVISIQQESVTIVTPTGETKVMELN